LLSSRFLPTHVELVRWILLVWALCARRIGLIDGRKKEIMTIKVNHLEQTMDRFGGWHVGKYILTPVIKQREERDRTGNLSQDSCDLFLDFPYRFFALLLATGMKKK
jgi:hypothetical protein